MEKQSVQNKGKSIKNKSETFFCEYLPAEESIVTDDVEITVVLGSNTTTDAMKEP